MKLSEQDGLDGKFVEAWQTWVNRPPKLHAAEAAARVAARIARPADRRPTRWVLAAAAAVLLAVGGSTVLWKRDIAAPPQQQASADPSLQLGTGEVLIWLDEQTPLYMTFQAPEATQDKGDKQ